MNIILTTFITDCFLQNLLRYSKMPFIEYSGYYQDKLCELKAFVLNQILTQYRTYPRLPVSNVIMSMYRMQIIIAIHLSEVDVKISHCH